VGDFHTHPRFFVSMTEPTPQQQLFSSPLLSLARWTRAPTAVAKRLELALLWCAGKPRLMVFLGLLRFGYAPTLEFGLASEVWWIHGGLEILFPNSRFAPDAR
jgi:hypothetical protein